MSCVQAAIIETQPDRGNVALSSAMWFGPRQCPECRRVIALGVIRYSAGRERNHACRTPIDLEILHRNGAIEAFRSNSYRYGIDRIDFRRRGWHASQRPSCRYNDIETFGGSMRTALITALLLVAAASTATAAPAYYGPASGYGPGPGGMLYPGRPGVIPQSRRAQGPGDEFKRGMQQMLSFLQRSPAPSANELAAFVDQEIAPYFDFDYMAKTAAGPGYRGMDAKGQQALVERLKRSFLSTLTEKLSGYGGQGMRFIGSRSHPDGRTATVNVAIANPGTYPARLTFRMYRGKEGWKVYDVAANGQSAVAHYRRQLRQGMPGVRGPVGRPTTRSAPMRGYR